MFRPASRLIARPAALRTLPRASIPARRFLSTAPPTQKSRSWKSLVARVGIAGAIIYYYNTTDVFAEEPRHLVQPLPETDTETEELPSIDAMAQQRQQRRSEALASQKPVEQETASAGGAEGGVGGGLEGGVEGLEEEADQQGAFNPETGEINWDCPCLGGMAHGPCGEEFKAAFSCFVYSTEDPKGMDCVDKFKDMQNCFRQYPDVYGAELETDEEDDVTADHDQPYAAADSAVSEPQSEPKSEPVSTPKPTSKYPLASENSQPKEKVGPAAPKKPSDPAPDRYEKQERAKAATKQVNEHHGDAEKIHAGPTAAKEPGSPGSDKPKGDGEKEKVKAATEQMKKDHEPTSESQDLVPKAWHDASADNEKAGGEEKK